MARPTSRPATQAALGIGQAQALRTEVRAEHVILGAKVREGLGLVAAQPGGDQQDEELKRSSGRHGESKGSGHAQTRKGAR